MNALSWLLYASDVVESLRGTAYGVMLLFDAIFIGSGAATIVSNSLPDDDSWREGAPQSFKKMAKSWFGTSIWALALLNILVIVSPTKATVLSIAASEFAEYVVSTEQVQNMGGEAGDLISNSIKLLNEKITDQLNPPKGNE